jgi:hypothetical protein
MPPAASTRAVFSQRGAPVDLRYEHYNHQRCFGRNWLLAGTSCCQFWFPSAAGVATGLIAARLAPDVLKAPAHAPRFYQAYINQVASGHSGLDWLVRDDPASVITEELQQRAQAMIGGNVKRLGDYLALHRAPSELAFNGHALRQLYLSDRLRANPLSVDVAPSEAQATRLFATEDAPDPWMDAPREIAVLTRPDKLDGPPAILDLVDILSGRSKVDASDGLVAEGVKLQIDQFQLEGVAQWNAWVSFLRGAPRVKDLELVPGSLAGSNSNWTLTAQWQGSVRGQASVSPQFSMTFLVANYRVASIQMRRKDCTFVVGDAILPEVAFAAVVGNLGSASS